MTKNLLLVVCLAFFAMTANAQIIYENNFDAGLGDMTVVDVDMQTPNANVAALTGAWSAFSLGQDADNQAVNTSYYTPAGSSDDWLILPALEIPEDGYNLIFDAFTPNGTYPDGYTVLVSTTDMEIESFTETLFSIDAEELTWTKRALLLDAFSGQTIHIAFRNTTFDGVYIAIDNLTVQKLKVRSVTAGNVTNQQWNLTNADIQPTMLVTNNGGEELTSLDVTYDWKGNAVTETVTGLSIATFDTEEVALTGSVQLSEAIASGENLTLTISNPNAGAEDAEDMNDNTAEKVLSGLVSVPNRKIVAEEGTGTWCGWCPRGAVFMDYMSDNFEDFIGIAVHNGDPMTVTAYDNAVGFSGYPSAHVNRSFLDVDPSQFEGLYNDMKALRQPFDCAMSLTYDKDTREVKVTATATSRTTFLNGDYNFALIMTEDDVTGTAGNYAQANYYSGGTTSMGGYENLADPVPAADMIYDHVARAIVDGFSGSNGSIPSGLAPDQEVTFDYTYTIPDGMNPQNMHAVVVIIDNASGEIFNGASDIVQAPVSIFNTKEEIAAKLYPNPATDVAQVELNLDEATNVAINVIDVTGKVVATRNYGIVQGNQVFPINVGNFNNGIYLVQINTDNGSTTRRLTVAK